MPATSLPPPPTEVVYPESDGLPMAGNTKQFEWIVLIKENLDILLPDAFVAGDLFWYPVEGNPYVKQAPDVMVALDRPKGHRRSYLQGNEANIAPRVVFEILSPGNTGIRFELLPETLHIYRPGGVKFLGFAELKAQKEQSQREKEEAQRQRNEALVREQHQRERADRLTQ